MENKFTVNNLKNSKLILLLLFFLSVSCGNQKRTEKDKVQLDNEDTEKISLVSEKSETKSDAYFEIGPIDCYALDYIEEYETTGFGNTDGMLYAKTYNGKDFFCNSKRIE